MRHTIVVDGMIIQRRENGGQKRLLEQISGEQLPLQNVSHRFGRFIMIIGRVLRVILKTPLTNTVIRLQAKLRTNLLTIVYNNIM